MSKTDHNYYDDSEYNKASPRKNRKRQNQNQRRSVKKNLKGFERNSYNMNKEMWDDEYDDLIGDETTEEKW